MYLYVQFVKPFNIIAFYRLFESFQKEITLLPNSLSTKALLIIYNANFNNTCKQNLIAFKLLPLNLQTYIYFVYSIILF